MSTQASIESSGAVVSPARFHFSIRQLFFATTWFAVMVVGLLNASRLLASVAYTVTVFALTLAILWAIYSRESRRAYWLGFVIGGISFMQVGGLSGSLPGMSFAQASLPSDLYEYLYSRLLPLVRTPPTPALPPAPGGTGFFSVPNNVSVPIATPATTSVYEPMPVPSSQASSAQTTPIPTAQAAGAEPFPNATPLAAPTYGSAVTSPSTTPLNPYAPPSTSPPTVYYSTSTSWSTAPGGFGGLYPEAHEFYTVAHSFMTLTVAICAGWYASFLHRRMAQRQQEPKTNSGAAGVA
jgi:hypothetical protein